VGCSWVLTIVCDEAEFDGFHLVLGRVFPHIVKYMELGGPGD